MNLILDRKFTILFFLIIIIEIIVRKDVINIKIKNKEAHGFPLEYIGISPRILLRISLSNTNVNATEILKLKFSLFRFFNKINKQIGI